MLTSSKIGLAPGNALEDNFCHGPPAPSQDRDRSAGRHVVVVDSGHAAANTLKLPTQCF
jgi:hypothetical protein